MLGGPRFDIHELLLPTVLTLGVVPVLYPRDPDIYGVETPLLRYPVGTIGPSLRTRLAPGLGLQVDAGYSFQRRFELFDGDDEDNLSDYSLKNAAFARVMLQYGG